MQLPSLSASDPEEEAVIVSDLKDDADEVEEDPRLPAYEHGSPNKA